MWLPWCVRLEVDHQAGFDVHSPVALTLAPRGLLPCRRLKAPVQRRRPEGVTESRWRDEIEMHARQ
eukprot:3124667-Alexandrium_andersonii.AAC.1